VLVLLLLLRQAARVRRVAANLLLPLRFLLLQLRIQRRALKRLAAISRAKGGAEGEEEVARATGTMTTMLRRTTRRSQVIVVLAVQQLRRRRRRVLLLLLPLLIS
jgi:hypothetical protein